MSVHTSMICMSVCVHVGMYFMSVCMHASMHGVLVSVCACMHVCVSVSACIFAIIVCLCVQFKKKKVTVIGTLFSIL